MFNEIMNHDALDQSQFNILELHETSWKDPYQHDTPMFANQSILNISNHMMKSPTRKSLTIQILVQQVFIITTCNFQNVGFFKQEDLTHAQRWMDSESLLVHSLKDGATSKNDIFDRQQHIGF